MKVIRVIDRGGFGRVEEVELRRGVYAARKVFDPQMHLNPEDLAKMRTRFEREVKVQSSLPSHIALPIIQKGLKVETPWYVMPLADRNYWQQIQDDRAGNTITLQPIADILNALEELHTLGFVHRDLKPENILFHDGKWKLSDFGLVMFTEATSDRLTSTSSVWGTRLYMAPEQYTGFRGVTPAADIYAVGCILNDLVSDGERIPFQQVTCEGPLGPILEKCTEKDPTRRFADIRKLRDALFAALLEPSEESGEGPASQWVLDLAEASSWTVEKLEEFVRFLRRLDLHSETASDVCRLIDESVLEAVYQLDLTLWASLTDFYFEWTQQNFDFAFCDVIVTRLGKIFDLGNTAQKARAVLSAARLGHSHNRWYVMQHVLSMAGPRLEESVAQRLAIEITINDARDDFIACAGGLNHTPDDYHPAVARVLLRPEEPS